MCTFNVEGSGLGFLEQSFGEAAEINGQEDGSEDNTGSEGDLSGDEEEDDVIVTSSSSTTPRKQKADRGGPSCDENLAAGTKVELPCWAAETLARRNFLTIHLPRFYSKSVRNDLRAGPLVVNLSEKCLYFYELGHYLSDLLIDDELSQLLTQAYAERCWRVVDSAGWEGKAKGVMAAMKRLDNIERRLYLTATGVIGSYDRWKERRGDRIAPPKLHRKRTRDETSKQTNHHPVSTRA